MTRRTPVLRPRAAAGRGLPCARHLRVLVDEQGALVVDRPDQPREVLAAPGTVRRLLFLEPDRARELLGRDGSHAGAVALLTSTGPVLALRLMEWAPPTQHDVDATRRATGVEALAAALDVPVEPAKQDEPDRTALRSVELRPLAPRAFPGKATYVLGPLSALLAFLAWPASGSAAAAVLTASALLLIAPVLLGVAQGRASARAHAPLAEPTGDGIVIRVRPGRPVPAACLDHVLELRPDELMLRRRGTAGWLAGPASGGVVQAVFEPEHVRLTDADGLDHAVLETALWCGDDAARADLADELRAGGLTVQDWPIDTVPTHDRGDLSSASVSPSQLQSDVERGDPTVLAPYFGGLTPLLACGGALATISWEPAVGLPLLAIAVGLLALSLSMAWRRRREDRAAVRAVDPAARPARRPA